MLANRSALTILIGVLAAAPGLSSDEPPARVEYAAESWSERDGLPSHNIWALAQDGDGYIWLGTDEGLVRFDGVRFVRWNAMAASPLPDQRVVSLLSAADGSLWVGFAGAGIAHISGQRVRRFGEADGLADGVVRALMEDRQRTIWAAGPGGLYWLTGERWQKVGPAQGVPIGRVSDMYQDTTGHLWIATAEGVYRRGPDAPQFVRIDRVSSILNHFSEDAGGAIWTTDPDRGFRQVFPRPSTTRRAHGLTGYGVQLLHDRRGNLWVGTLGQGLWQVTRATSPAPVVTRTSFAGDAVRRLMEDREGHIWVGTQGGLHRVSATVVTGLRHFGVVRAVDVAPDGSMWVGTASGLIAVNGAGAERRVLPYSVSALHHDPAGTLWIGTDRGLFRSADGKPTPIQFPDGMTLQRIVTIVSDTSGSLWLSDRDRGVFRWTGGALTPLSTVPQLGRPGAYALYPAGSSHIWLGATAGRVFLTNGSSGSEFQDSQIGGFPRAIHQDRHGYLWLASDAGLIRFKDGVFVAATRANGLPANAVSAIIEDGDGQLWAGLSTGIVQIDPREFDALAADAGHQLRYRLYDKSDGIAGVPLWLGNPSASRAADGRLWFVTGDGVTIVNPRGLGETRLTPRATIEAIVVDDARVDPLESRTLPPTTRRLQIEYTALGFMSPSKTRFRYRLDGFDTDWIDAGTRRQAFYTNLPPRGYRFEVVATTSEGNATATAAAWEFAIAPAFYQTRSFYALGALAPLIIGYAAWRLRLRNMRREFSLVLAERTRVSRELHDTLLQSLVGVALQIEAVAARVESAPPGLKQQLSRIRMQVEDYIREARQAIWNLRSPLLERRTLPEALQELATHAAVGSAVRVDVELAGAPRPCPAKVEEQLLRIGQEAISNAVRHAGASHVRVQLAYEERLLRLRIRDDGRGFDAGELRARPDSHYGLQSMRERAADAGGEFTLVTGPGRGTQIEAAVPLAPPSSS